MSIAGFTGTAIVYPIKCATVRALSARFYSSIAMLIIACLVITSLPAAVPAQDDDEDMPGSFGEATGKFAKEERDAREAEGLNTGVDLGKTTTEIPAAELKKLEEEVRVVFKRMCTGFVSGDVNAILALYADSYGFMGNKKTDIGENITEYLADYDDTAMDVKKFRVTVLKSLDDPKKYYADASLVFDRSTVRTGNSREERLKKGTPQSVEKMKEDADFKEAGEALEEFYSSQKHPLDTSHVDQTPMGKEVKKDVKANFRLEKTGDSWQIIEAEFGTTRKTVFMTPEEKMKKFAIFVPAAAILLFVIGLVLFKLKDLAGTSEQITVKEGEFSLSKDYKKEMEAEIHNFINGLSKGKHDEEVEKLLKAQLWEDARMIIRDRITIAHELHDRNMGALYASYEKKILEWETRYANFY
jgi:hypothetical protein